MEKKSLYSSFDLVLVACGSTECRHGRMREFQIKTFLFLQMMSNDEYVSFHVPWAWDRGADSLPVSKVLHLPCDYLRLAMLEIETQGLKDLVFTCRHGIHRSVGCACLLVMLFYPEAKLVFHKDRAMEAAWRRSDPCAS